VGHGRIVAAMGDIDLADVVPSVGEERTS
jgi:hypothetical protein